MQPTLLQGSKQKALELVDTLAINPNAGSTGDVSFIENVDQDNDSSSVSG